MRAGDSACVRGLQGGFSRDEKVLLHTVFLGIEKRESICHTVYFIVITKLISGGGGGLFVVVCVEGGG
jgi:hypothetical protein